MKYQILTEIELATMDLNNLQLIVDNEEEFDCEYNHISKSFTVEYNGELISAASGEFETDHRKGIVYHSVFVRLAETGEPVEVEVVAPLFS
jgi:hypothetical protein